MRSGVNSPLSHIVNDQHLMYFPLSVSIPQVLTRLLSEGRTRETASSAGNPRKKNAVAAGGLPLARTESVLGWTSAVLDSHFTRLAMGGAADANLVGCLKALQKTVGGETECCELLCQVRCQL